MATSLFSEVRNRQLSEQLGSALDNNYTARPIVRTGIVLNTNQVQVGNQRYVLSGGGSDLVVGSRLAVQNIGRSASAVYTPTTSISASLISSAGIMPSDSTGRGSGDAPPGGHVGTDTQITNGTLNNSQFVSLHGVIGNLTGNYGYTTETYGSAFGDYATVNITTDPTNGFRIRNYETPVFQADVNGVVWALSSLRAGTGNDTVGITATDGTWRLYAGDETPANADFRVDKTGKLYATEATITAGAGAVLLDSDGVSLTAAAPGGVGSLKIKSGVKLIGEFQTDRDSYDDIGGGIYLYNYDATSNISSSFGAYHSVGGSARYTSLATPTSTTNTIIGKLLVLNIGTATGTVLAVRDNFAAEYWALTNAGTMIGPAWKPASDSTTALQMQKANGTAVVTLDTTGGATPATVEVVGDIYASAGFLTKDVVPADFTIPAGYSMIYPNMSVPGGVTVTVEGTLIDFVLS